MTLIKLNTDGTFNTMKLYGGTEEDKGSDIITTSDGGYLIGGCTNSFGQPNAGNVDCAEMFLVKLTSGLATTWSKSYGQTGSYNDFLSNLVQSGTSYLVGGVSGGQVSMKFVYMTLSSSGSITGSRRLSNTSGLMEGGDVFPITGGYIMNGRSLDTVPTNNSQLYTARINAQGNVASCSDTTDAPAMVSADGGSTTNLTPTSTDSSTVLNFTTSASVTLVTTGTNTNRCN